MKNLKKQVILISGGSGLLGQEFVKALIAKKAIVVNLDLKTSGNKEAEFIKCDITDKKSIQIALNKVLASHGKIDALVSCAYPKNKNFGRRYEEVEYNDFCENVNLHLGGYFLLSQQVIHQMKKQKHGQIIFLASVYGVIAPKFEIYEGTKMTMPVEYAVIKAAIIHLAKYLAEYHKNYNIKVNCISPGGILDNQPEVFVKNYREHCLSKGMLDKTDVNETLLSILSDPDSHKNGANIIVDDGFSS